MSELTIAIHFLSNPATSWSQRDSSKSYSEESSQENLPSKVYQRELSVLYSILSLIPPSQYQSITVIDKIQYPYPADLGIYA